MSRPPRLVTWLLSRILPAGLSRDGTLGDLHETFERRAARDVRSARRWYRRQAVTIAVRFLMQRRPARGTRGPTPTSSGTMGTITHDLRYALRQIRRRPGFALVTIVTLGLGIGANTAIFSVSSAVLWRPLPYPDGDRLAVLWTTNRGDDSRTAGRNYLDWREQSSTFAEMGLYGGASFFLAEPGKDPSQLSGAVVTPSYFTVLGVPPLLGRTLTDADDTPGVEPVAVMSHALWVNRFGADPDIIGQRLTIDETPTTIVGVMPPLPYPIAAPTIPAVPLAYDSRHLWMPITTRRNCMQSRTCHVYVVLGRLRPDATVADAQAEMTTIARQLEEANPGTNVGSGVRVEGLRAEITESVRAALTVLTGTVALVLLIACTNLINLFLVHASARRDEVAVRTALGAGRGRLLQQFLIESLVLCGIGGAVGLALATGGLRLLLGLNETLPRGAEVGLSGTALAFNAGITLVAGVLVGLFPAVAASTDGAAGRRTTATAQRQLVRRALVVGEVTLAVVLVIGAGLLLKSFWRLTRVDGGFVSQGVTVATVHLPASSFTEVEQLSDFAARAAETLRAQPGIASAAVGMDHPLDATWGDGFTIAGRPVPAAGQGPTSRFRPVGPGYLRTMGITLVRGRPFTDRDVATAPGVTIVNEALADRYFPGEDPIGQSLNISAPRLMWGADVVPTTFEIVGVAHDVHFLGLANEVEPAYYVPFAQGPYWFARFFVRTADGQPLAEDAVRDVIRSVDPRVALESVTTMDDISSASVATPRFNAVLIAVFGALALTLAVVGVYGIVSYVASQRAREIGIRIALGAVPSHVFRRTIAAGIVLVGTGVAAGVPLAVASTRFLRSLLFEVAPFDPAMYVGVPVLLVLVAALASLGPARRASRIDPVEVLRVS